MKRKIFSFSFAAVVVSLLFTSCLGDNDTTYKVDNDFVYITTAGGVKAAASTQNFGMYITSSEIVSSAIEGRCYFAGYSASDQNMTGGVFNAENLKMGAPIPQSGPIQLNTPAPTSGPIFEESIGVNTFNVRGYQGSAYIGDKWWLSIYYKMAQGDVLTGYLYYDQNKQYVNDAHTALAKNVMVLDILFTKTNADPTAVAGTGSEYQYVADLARIRSSAPLLQNAAGASILDYNYEEQGKSYAPLQIIFRYKKLDGATTTTTTDAYFPSATGTSAYIMYIAKS